MQFCLFAFFFCVFVFFIVQDKLNAMTINFAYPDDLHCMDLIFDIPWNPFTLVVC